MSRIRKLLLIVDDCSDTRELYERVFHFAGYNVIEAEFGIDAVDKAVTFQPDAIIMDLSLVGAMSGVEAARRIKENPRTALIPIIAVSGYGRSDFVERLAVDAFLLKPVYVEELVRVVKELTNTP